MTAHLPYRKALVALAGVLGQALTLGMLHGTAANVAQLALAALTALGVYGVSNTEPADDGGEADLGLLLLVGCFVGVVLLLFGVRFDG